MSQSLSQTFLAITRNNTDLEWLQSALGSLGQVVSAGTDAERPERRTDAERRHASWVFVCLQCEARHHAVEVHGQAG